MTDLVFRPLRDEGEFKLFSAITAPLPVTGVGVRAKPFEDLLEEYRPDWLWLAQRGDEVVGRAAFWGPAGAEHPWALDHFDFDTVETGAALLVAAYVALVGPDYVHPWGSKRPEYSLFLPPDWRERPDAFAEASVRIEAAERAGLTLLVERLAERWEPEWGLPPRSTRLTFEPVGPGDEPLRGLLEQIVSGSLDAYDLRDVRELGVEGAAGHALESLNDMDPGRSRWRYGYDAAGDLVGMVLPVDNGRFATIGYIGVDRRHRGRGYAFDLLAEALHLFAAEGRPYVLDNTDVGNHPMAATFARAGYRVTGRRMIFT
ncbi:GNAT family N-acetyltransferase [Nonomuraea sp. NPDC050328]|uniref:GNAT family N-acetyltransferase n=1 Tax=Nonomuraea sp. NPDC050328 TaxID=3364361 RepID=UPI00379D626A